MKKTRQFILVPSSEKDPINVDDNNYYYMNFIADVGEFEAHDIVTLKGEFTIDCKNGYIRIGPSVRTLTAMLYYDEDNHVLYDQETARKKGFAS